jgi:hypothetical protein
MYADGQTQGRGFDQLLQAGITLVLLLQGIFVNVDTKLINKSSMLLHFLGQCYLYFQS